jgi:hypothetical protein
MPSRILYFLMLVLMGSGCCRQQDLQLSPALQAWAPYADQQELTFTSATGPDLVFVAGVSQFNTAATDKVCGDYAVENRQVDLAARDHPSFKIQVTLSHQILFKIKAMQVLPPSLGLEKQFNTLSERYVTDDFLDKYFEQLELNGRTYSKVLWAYGSPGAGPLSPAEIYYARDKGLVGFKLFSGESYFLK